MASFQQRKNGSITAKIRRHGVTKSATFATRSDAEAWARKVESEIERGRWHDSTEAERTTIAELVSEYRKRVLPGLRGRGVAPALNVINEKLGKHTVARLTARHVASYRDERMLAVGVESVRKELAVLSKMLDVAGKEWGVTIPSNPVKSVTKPRPGRSRKRRLLPGEQERIEASLKKCRSTYMLPLFRLALETTARQGELLSMRWPHIDSARKNVTFYDTKNGEDRSIPLSSKARLILDGLPRVLRDDRVFPVSSGLVAQAWGHAIARARRLYEKERLAAGDDPAALEKDPLLRDLHFHDLRHEGTSRLFELGTLSVMEIAKITGHKTLSMLESYTHLFPENLAQKLP